MRLDFHHAFSGVAGRCREVKHDRAVDQRALRIVQRKEMGVTRLNFFSREKPLEHPGHFFRRSGKPNDADSAESSRACAGNDRILVRINRTHLAS